MDFAILGGGMGGLSAAHELVKLGHTVRVYERADTLGGKARSNGKPGSATGTRKPLPGEHGFRFFPGFYKHVVASMQDVPTPAGTLADNLVDTLVGAFAQEGKPLVLFPTVPPASNPFRLFAAFGEQFSLPELGLTDDDALYFASKLFRFATSCKRRRDEEYEQISWWDFLDADNRSVQFQKVLAAGMTRSLVAMKPHDASTRTIGTILLQMVFTLTIAGRGVDRVLNAPTSDAWIEPWAQHLRDSGLCTFEKGVEVESFVFDGASITGVNVRDATGTRVVTASQYISALPVEVMAAVIARTPAIAAAAPSLAHLDELSVEWMNGIQYYLQTDIPYAKGHMIAVDSNWALTCISQAQFWNGVDLANYGDGTVKGVLSVDISDWTTPGKYLHTVPASECASAQQVSEECWAQLVPHFAATSTPLPAQPHDWYLDPSISFSTPALRGVMRVADFVQAQCKAAPAFVPVALQAPPAWSAQKPASGPGPQQLAPAPTVPPPAVTVANLEPLLINKTGSLQFRPQAGTEISNLFLASDYVFTFTDLACMEGANEAGRRAVNAFLVATNSTQPPCMVQDLEEPAFLDGLKALDEVAYEAEHPTFP